MDLLSIPGLDPGVDWAAVAPLVDVHVAVSFQRCMVLGRTSSSDGLHIVEFDARPWLAQASDEEIVRLADEWFVGDGPACRRVLEHANADTQAFLSVVDRCKVDWLVTFDMKRSRAWIEQHRPHLAINLDPLMAG